MSDETFLESFIGESLATLPHEMRRSMELVKDLDQRGQADWSRLLELQHQFLQQAEETVLSQLQVVELMPDEEEDADLEEEDITDVTVRRNESQDNNSSKKRKKGYNQQQGVRERKQPKKKYGVLVLKSDGTSFDPEDYNPDTDAVIPTTDELFQLILTSQDHAMSSNKSKKETSPATSNITTYNEIRRLQRACWQTVEEKVAVARQAWERLDAQVQRLEADLRALETQLAQQHGPDWAAALLLGGLTSNGVSNNSNINTSMTHLNAGTTSSTGKPNDLVACQVTPGSEWILAKIILHDPDTGNFKLADEDSESNKIFDLPEQQVILLTGNDLRLSKGDAVYAIYPDTTSFYPAHVVQAPRKQNTAQQQYVMVTFIDDSDEFGITHDKAVPLQHVMPPPYGAL